MVLILPPAPELAALVHAYWFVEDRPGDHAGRPIRTSPVPLAVLSVNFGRANAAEDGSLIPAVSLLGLQSRSRTWHSWPDTCFVMVMMTIPGLVRLFPNTGSSSADRLLELAAITGDAGVQSLTNSIDMTRDPRWIAAALDRWLLSWIACTRQVSECEQITMAHSILRRGGTIEKAAAATQINRRHLHRLFHRHLGVAPKDVADLERLHASLKSVQCGRGDPMQGFSDQAHQIRNWRRRLGVTPGVYARTPRAPLANQVDLRGASEGIAYYL